MAPTPADDAVHVTIEIPQSLLKDEARWKLRFVSTGAPGEKRRDEEAGAMTVHLPPLTGVVYERVVD